MTACRIFASGAWWVARKVSRNSCFFELSEPETFFTSLDAEAWHAMQVFSYSALPSPAAKAGFEIDAEINIVSNSAIALPDCFICMFPVSICNAKSTNYCMDGGRASVHCPPLLFEATAALMAAIERKPSTAVG